MNTGKHLIRILRFGPEDFRAVDEDKGLDSRGASAEEAAIKIVSKSQAAYGLAIVDLARIGLGAANPDRKAMSITIFNDKQGGTSGYCARFKKDGRPIDSFSRDHWQALFSLICGYHAIFEIDFDTGDLCEQSPLPAGCEYTVVIEN